MVASKWAQPRQPPRSPRRTFTQRGAMNQRISESYRAVVRSESGVALARRPRLPLPPVSVRVRIKRTGLCLTDCRAAQGLLPTAGYVTLGHEASGIVSEVAESKGAHIRVGDHVAIWPHLRCGVCQDCQLGLDCSRVQLGVEQDGTFAEEVTLPQGNVFRVPSTMSFERAAYFEPLVAALGALLPAVAPKDTMYVHGEGRIAELTRRTLRACGKRLVQSDEDPTWCVLPAPTVALMAELVAEAPRTTFILKLASRGAGFDRETYERAGARFVTSTYGSQSKALALLEDPTFPVDDLFETAVPLHVLCERLLAPDRSPKKAFFDPELQG